MTTNDYQQHQDLIQDLVAQIDDLLEDNTALSVQLKSAVTEIADLQYRIMRLEYGQLDLFWQALTTKEIHQLDWQLHHQVYRRKTDTRPPKYH